MTHSLKELERRRLIFVEEMKSLIKDAPEEFTKRWAWDLVISRWINNSYIAHFFSKDTKEDALYYLPEDLQEEIRQRFHKIFNTNRHPKVTQSN